LEFLGAIAAVGLGAIFVVAGAAKLALGAAWPAQARAMGAPMPIATIVPGVELVIGATLIARIAMPLPALAAIVLLVSFSVLIARQLVDGRHPPCACFGAWSHRPLSGAHLARNAVLVAVAVVALWAP
jgi:Methylamine utilisation protein MauE